jgi:histidinol phosphatase-like enzyme
MDEIVLISGYPAAGKSTLTEGYVTCGYHRVNRDTIGGSLDGLVAHVQKAYNDGKRKFVLDNTYANRESRKSIIDCAKSLGLPIHCVWLNTSFEDAQFNACQRMIRTAGVLLMPEELKKNCNPNLFPPVTLFDYKKRFEKPTTDEGFDSVEESEFKRVIDPIYNKTALILDADDCVRKSDGPEKYPCLPEHVEILPGRRKRIERAIKEEGYDYLLGVSNQSGIAKKKLTKEQADACFARTNELLGLDVKWYYCPHNIPPVTCFCRKPHSGIGVLLIETYKLRRGSCKFIGDQRTDETFAQRCGFQFENSDNFFNDNSI